jgi:DNA-directed RNA polymerase, mitochondrial
MEWLAECARLVAKEGQPVSWVTPLGLPVIQPYRAMHKATVKTVMQVVRLRACACRKLNIVSPADCSSAKTSQIQLVDDCDELSVNAQRQRSAFPPNFVHSLDSTHMLLTAMRMQNLGGLCCHS